MRLSHGSRSIFSSGSASLPPCPPKRVRVVIAVRWYESYCFGQLTPHCAGSVVSSVTSTRRTYGLRASTLRSLMLMSNAVTAAVTAATTRSDRDRDRERPALLAVAF